MKIDKEIKLRKISFETTEDCESIVGIVRYFANFSEKEVIPVTEESQRLLTFARKVIAEAGK